MSRNEISHETYEAIAEEFNITATYSGRGMYGNVCLGLTGRIDDLMRFVAWVVAADLEDLTIDMLTLGMSQDNMGLDMIYYWPNIIVTPPAETNEEPDEMKVF